MRYLGEEGEDRDEGGGRPSDEVESSHAVKTKRVETLVRNQPRHADDNIQITTSIRIKTGTELCIYDYKVK